ncbi:YgaP-like transmembrane domain [Streptomyces sp. NPDC048481]|uniref:YgaP-like transmembrane domain n=1 Tax=Streptomyces sp. NPDC048481 TaxID=3365557 RepID=UPI00371B072C
MDRQARLTAGSIILLGLILGAPAHVAFVLLSAAVAGLVHSALSNTCAMATLLGKLPYSRTDRAALDTTLAALRHG